MNGWVMLCIVILAVSADAPMAAAIAIFAWALDTSPKEYVERLERRVRKLEGK